MRMAGEEWLVRYEEVQGPYIPGVDEMVVRTVNAYILEIDIVGLHLCAKRTFKDSFGKQRKAGEQWLITAEDRGFFFQIKNYENIISLQ